MFHRAVEGCGSYLDAPLDYVPRVTRGTPLGVLATTF